MCYTRIHERTKGVYMKNRKVFTLLLTGMLTLSMGSTVYASGTDAAIAEAQAEKQAAEGWTCKTWCRGKQHHSSMGTRSI